VCWASGRCHILHHTRHDANHMRWTCSPIHRRQSRALTRRLAGGLWSRHACRPKSYLRLSSRKTLQSQGSTRSRGQHSNIGAMGIEHHGTRRLWRTNTRGPHACVWPAWRSVGSSSGHTVGGMRMQPAGVPTCSTKTAMQVYANARGA
jgi:hypothetical protein